MSDPPVDPLNPATILQVAGALMQQPQVQQALAPSARKMGEMGAGLSDVVVRSILAVFSPRRQNLERIESDERIYKEVLATREQITKTHLAALARAAESAASEEMIGGSLFLAELVQEVAEILQDDFIPAKPHVAKPALDALIYSEDEAELRQLYTKLLAKSMDRSRAHQAHPAFVEIIKQMSPDEARLIRAFAEFEEFPTVRVMSVEYRQKPQGVEAYNHEVMSTLTLIDEVCPLVRPDLGGGHLGNLERLGLIIVNTPTPQNQFTVSDESRYKPLVSHPRVRDALSRVLPPNKGVVARGSMAVTPFGRLFCAACVDKAAA